MAGNTAFSPEDIKNAATEIGKLSEDMAAFQDLKPHWPNAGQFELAQWLERVVDDRRNASERITIIADRGNTVENDQGSFLILQNGTVHHLQTGRRDPNIVTFERHALDLAEQLLDRRALRSAAGGWNDAVAARLVAPGLHAKRVRGPAHDARLDDGAAGTVAG